MTSAMDICFPQQILAVKAEGGFMRSADTEMAELRDLRWSPSPQTRAWEGSEHPSRNKKISNNPWQTQPEGCRIWMWLLEQPLVLSTSAVLEPFPAFVLVSSALSTHRMLQRHLRSATFPYNRSNLVQQCPRIQVGNNTCSFKGKLFPF